jgi:hypothetical protein
MLEKFEDIMFYEIEVFLKGNKNILKKKEVREMIMNSKLFIYEDEKKELKE